MKIVAVSDTHGKHQDIKIPECDVLIHAGDITLKGEEYTVAQFRNWIEDAPARYKIFIAGNHDFCFQRGPLPSYLRANDREKGVYYLENTGIELEGKKFFGTPWTPYFYNWAFNGTDCFSGHHNGPNLNDIFDLIPQELDVLISHGPPFKILDLNNDGAHCGSKILSDHIWSRKIKNVVFGHIHESYGKELDRKGVNYYNVSHLQRDYTTRNPLTVFEI